MQSTKRTRRWSVVCGGALLGSIACGGDDALVARKPRSDAAGGEAGATTAAGGNASAGSSAAGGTPAAGAGGAAGGAGGASRGYGYVAVVSVQGPASAESMLAGFYANVADRTPGKKPTTETSGPCVVTTYTADGTTAGGIRPSLSAGVITLTGGNGTSSITPLGGQYALGATPAAGQPYFNAGQTLKIAAAGDVVPAFEATLVAPTAASLSSPVRAGSSAEPLAVARTTDFSLAFTGTTGKVRAAINGKDSGGGSMNVVCAFAASAGTGIIPAAVLGRFAPGEASFSVDTVEEVRASAGNFDVDVRLLVGIGTAAGSEVQTKLTLQ